MRSKIGPQKHSGEAGLNNIVRTVFIMPSFKHHQYNMPYITAIEKSELQALSARLGSDYVLYEDISQPDTMTGPHATPSLMAPVGVYEWMPAFIYSTYTNKPETTSLEKADYAYFRGRDTILLLLSKDDYNGSAEGLASSKKDQQNKKVGKAFTLDDLRIRLDEDTKKQTPEGGSYSMMPGDSFFKGQPNSRLQIVAMVLLGFFLSGDHKA